MLCAVNYILLDSLATASIHSQHTLAAADGDEVQSINVIRLGFPGQEKLVR